MPCTPLTVAALAALLSLAHAQSSAGCGRPSGLAPGKSTDVTITVDGIKRSYRVHVPVGYDPNEAAPLVLSFHGWGGTAAGDERYLGLSTTADAHGFFAVYPQGFGDYGSSSSQKNWGSWNAVGTTGAKGTECTSSTNGYCYNSCGKCNRCSWVTCLDDDKFIGQIMDTMEADYCIDLQRIHATGYSNGGQMAYQVGITFASRVASIVPGGGQPHVGHNFAPDAARHGHVSIMDLHGTRDTTCPANTTVSNQGWNYEPVDNVMAEWARANGCSNPTETRRYPTVHDGDTSLYCVEFGNCGADVDVVRCSYSLAHHWIGYNTPGGVGAQMAWEFFETHPKKQTLASKSWDSIVAQMRNKTKPDRF